MFRKMIFVLIFLGNKLVFSFEFSRKHIKDLLLLLLLLLLFTQEDHYYCISDRILTSLDWIKSEKDYQSLALAYAHCVYERSCLKAWSPLGISQIFHGTIVIFWQNHLYLNQMCYLLMNWCCQIWFFRRILICFV